MKIHKLLFTNFRQLRYNGTVYQFRCAGSRWHQLCQQCCFEPLSLSFLFFHSLFGPTLPQHPHLHHIQLLIMHFLHCPCLSHCCTFRLIRKLILSSHNSRYTLPVFSILTLNYSMGRLNWRIQSPFSAMSIIDMS